MLSIAGYDPGGGAGVLADIKTFEAFRVNGMAVTTCITIQNESEFISCEWLPVKLIYRQMEILFKAHVFEYVKIGLVKDMDMLEGIIKKIVSFNQNIKIIWDPILKASAGFEFYNPGSKHLHEILKNIFLITPNLQEIEKLANQKTSLEGASELSKSCHVFLKGGHNKDKPGWDMLFEDSKQSNFRPKKGLLPPKHGSGCVLSAAITANLAKGFKLHRSCLKAKNYITEFLNSNEGLLGYHKQ